MNYQWNTRKLKGVVRQSFCTVLNKIAGSSQLLIVQPNLLPIINDLLTFTELTQKTPVRKIVLLDDQLKGDLPDILSYLPNVRLVFLIDIRTDLVVPEEISKVCQSLNLKKINIVHTTWSTEQSNNFTQLPHFVKSQLSQSCDVELSPWNILPIPQLDDDLLCANVLYNNKGDNMYLPQENSMKKATRVILLDNMVNCVESLLQETNTVITNAVYMGDFSKQFHDVLYERIKANSTIDDEIVADSLYSSKSNSNIETDLIVFERNIDPITPLLTQLSYIGVLDDFFEFGPNGKLIGKNEVSIDYLNDEIWDQLKYLNFGAVGPILNKMAKELQTKYDARHQAETVGEIKSFVDSLGSLQQEQKILKMHTTVSSDVLEEVEKDEKIQFNSILEFEQDILLDSLSSSIATDRILELIYEGQISRQSIIRLICLLSLCKDGLRDQDFDILKKELVDTYGIEICFQLEYLTREGFFTNKTLIQRNKVNRDRNTILLKKEYKYISKWLNTIPNEEEDQSKLMNPREPTFAYCGVSPLSIRLIQLLYDRTVLSKYYTSQQPFIMSREPSSQQTQDLFEHIYGENNLIQSSRWVPAPSEKLRRLHQEARSKDSNNQNNDIAILVFLGGVTLGEVALLKFLQTKFNEKVIRKRFVIIADGLVNGERFVQ